MAIPYDQAVLHLWGDTESGYVGDRIYVSSDLIHLIEFSLRPRARFTHSDANRTVFAADEVLHVVEGEMLLVNPESGEAVMVRVGESVFFRAGHLAPRYQPQRRPPASGDGTVRPAPVHRSVLRLCAHPPLPDQVALRR